ncbi:MULTISPECIES: DUF1189 family protein [Bhargavaea]|uniref:DUF1189 family protein n=1 Tax=Bhargavaea changchunensis TaxID=2134037 RepID=A0ABW2NFC4_9BACL|nr:DUF1189 family protein [Bhargavaea sp. CC-171006]
MKYIFVFVFITAVLSFISFSISSGDILKETELPAEDLKGIGPLLYPAAFVLQFLISTFYFYIKASIAALAGMGIIRIRGRRGEYRHLWRTSAVALTVPTLLLLADDLLGGIIPFATALSWAAALVYIWLAAGYYPKKAPAKRAVTHKPPARS